VNADLLRELRDGRWVQPTSATGVLGIGAAAFLLSYDALHSLALASGVRPGLARIWPGVLDGFIVVATLTVVAAKRASRSTWYPWALVVLFSAASVAFNILHAVDRTLAAAGWVAALVFAMPPVALVLATHLLLQQGVWRRQHARAAPAAGMGSKRGASQAAVARTRPAAGSPGQPELALAGVGVTGRPSTPPVSPPSAPGDPARGIVPAGSMSRPKRPVASSPAPTWVGPWVPATAMVGCCCASSAPATRPSATAPQGGRRNAVTRPVGRCRGRLRRPRLSRPPTAPSPSRQRHPGINDALLVSRPGLRGGRQASPDPTRPKGRH
jgi:hypothetical protein